MGLKTRHYTSEQGECLAEKQIPPFVRDDPCKKGEEKDGALRGRRYKGMKERV